jgi:hypothetical protein
MHRYPMLKARHKLFKFDLRRGNEIVTKMNFLWRRLIA